jgi:hypothetical protein
MFRIEGECPVWEKKDPRLNSLIVLAYTRHDSADILVCIGRLENGSADGTEGVRNCVE